MALWSSFPVIKKRCFSRSKEVYWLPYGQLRQIWVLCASCFICMKKAEVEHGIKKLASIYADNGIDCMWFFERSADNERHLILRIMAHVGLAYIQRIEYQVIYSRTLNVPVLWIRPMTVDQELVLVEVLRKELAWSEKTDLSNYITYAVGVSYS